MPPLLSDVLVGRQRGGRGLSWCVMVTSQTGELAEVAVRPKVRRSSSASPVDKVCASPCRRVSSELCAAREWRWLQRARLVVVCAGSSTPANAWPGLGSGSADP
jgi:hypothetical protein